MNTTVPDCPNCGKWIEAATEAARERNAMKDRLTACQGRNDMMVGALQQALELLCQGGSGLQYDPSWIRPRTMSIVEMRDACTQSYFVIHKALAAYSEPHTKL